MTKNKDIVTLNNVTIGCSALRMIYDLVRGKADKSKLNRNNDYVRKLLTEPKYRVTCEVVMPPNITTCQNPLDFENCLKSLQFKMLNA